MELALVGGICTLPCRLCQLACTRPVSGTRDVPWVSFLLLGTGLAFLFVGLRRAFGQPQQYRGRIAGPILGALSVLFVALLSLGVHRAVFRSGITVVTICMVNTVLRRRIKSLINRYMQGVWLLAFSDSNMAIRILIADDDSTIRMLLRRLLEGHSDWRVCSEAVNGVEAIEKVELFTPDLAILDLGMPIMNGVQAAREISKAKPQLPLLLISVQEVSRQLAEAARGAGFRGAVTKSRGHEIVEAVEALVNNEWFFVSN